MRPGSGRNGWERRLYYFSTIDSTNQYAKKLGEEQAPDGTIVIADEQTAGKGRSGRHWVTPPKSAIAFTILVRPKLPPSRISMVTLVKGLAVCNAIRQALQPSGRDQVAERCRDSWQEDLRYPHGDECGNGRRPLCRHRNRHQREPDFISGGDQGNRDLAGA